MPGRCILRLTELKELLLAKLRGSVLEVLKMYAMKGKKAYGC